MTYYVGRVGGVIKTASQTPTPDAQEVIADNAAELIAFLNPRPLNVIPFAIFIGRWTDAEYALLMQRRATAISGGNVSLVKQWDQAATMGQVDLNSPAAQSFKAAIVAANILTQARADVVFS